MLRFIMSVETKILDESIDAKLFQKADTLIAKRRKLLPYYVGRSVYQTLRDDFEVVRTLLAEFLKEKEKEKEHDLSLSVCICDGAWEYMPNATYCHECGLQCKHLCIKCKIDLTKNSGKFCHCCGTPSSFQWSLQNTEGAEGDEEV